MASIQLDESGEVFVTVDMPVGLRKANAPNDVLLVQALLAIVYNENPVFRAKRPTTGPAVVNSRLERGTPALIAHVHRTVLKRPNPQGFINKAPAAGSQLRFSTIYRLYLFAQSTDRILRPGSGEDLLTRLQREHSRLRGIPLTVGEVVITPRPDRAPLLMDASH